MSHADKVNKDDDLVKRVQKLRPILRAYRIKLDHLINLIDYQNTTKNKEGLFHQLTMLSGSLLTLNTFEDCDPATQQTIFDGLKRNVQASFEQVQEIFAEEMQFYLDNLGAEALTILKILPKNATRANSLLDTDTPLPTLSKKP
jgi:hypothetical protein